MPDPIRLLIVDDHMIVREGLRMICETLVHIEWVGEARDGREALDQVGALSPDVVLLDLKMPVMDGIAALEALRGSHPEVAVIILTTYQDDDLMRRGLSLGARGFLLKDTDRETLLKTIEAAHRGDTLLQPEILARALRAPGGAASPSGAPEASPLTAREREVLALVADGGTNRSIAYELGISERTVKAHLTHVYQKLAVDSRAAAVAEATRQGLIP
jgi:two-component system, NarL family, response regulator YdfI